MYTYCVVCMCLVCDFVFAEGPANGAIVISSLSTARDEHTRKNTVLVEGFDLVADN